MPSEPAMRAARAWLEARPLGMHKDQLVQLAEIIDREIPPLHDRCTKCSKVLHSMAEGRRGTCGPCHFAVMPEDTKRAMKRLLASAFNGASDDQKDEAVDEAMRLTRRDDNAPGGQG